MHILLLYSRINESLAMIIPKPRSKNGRKIDPKDFSGDAFFNNLEEKGVLRALSLGGWVVLGTIPQRQAQ